MFLVTVSNFISLSDLHWILPYVSDYRWSVALIWPRLYSMSSKCLSATVWCSSSWLTTCGCVLPSFSGRERAISSSAGSALSWLTSMNTAINKRQCSKHDSKLVIYFFLFFKEFWKNNITGTWTHIFYINFFLSWKKIICHILFVEGELAGIPVVRTLLVKGQLYVERWAPSLYEKREIVVY